MRPLAESLSTIGNILAITRIIVALLMGAIGVWAAFRAANPRQQLVYQVTAVVPLLTAESRDARDLVEILLDGKKLTDPQIVEIYLANRGRRDIPTIAFDQDRPLQMDIAATVAKILKVQTAPAGFKEPPVDFDGTRITIGPDLIKRRQSVTLSLLVDGPKPDVTVPETPFIDIDIRAQKSNTELTPRAESWWSAAAAVPGCVALGGLALLIASIARIADSEHPLIAVLDGVAGAAIMLVGIWATVVTWSKASRFK